MDVNAYLRRVGYVGGLEPSLATLRGLHRAHLLAIPYENLDIHLGRELSLDLSKIYQKLVIERRGGWCFEMNGLFAWILGELGFEVTMLSAAVNRHRAGDRAEGNHLTLLVMLDKPYLADVGFGDGMLEPLILEEGKHLQGFLRYGLESRADRWIFHNHQHGSAERFDFTLKPAKLSDFADACQHLQTSPDSGFVKVTVCQRFTPQGITSLRGAVLTRITAAGISEQTIRSADEYAHVLRRQFGLQIDAYELWSEVWRSHVAWVKSVEGQKS